MTQLHKRFSDEQVKTILERYLSRGIKVNYILEILKVKRRQFFELIKEYKHDLSECSISYNRKKHPRGIGKGIEKNIVKELRIEKRLD